LASALTSCSPLVLELYPLRSP